MEESMKKENYVAPEAELIEFDFREQILTSGGGRGCNTTFDESRWNSPGLALCGNRFTN